jgi:hypothetical protein
MEEPPEAGAVQVSVSEVAVSSETTGAGETLLGTASGHKENNAI